MTSRRSFFRRVVRLVGAVVVAPFVPTPKGVLTQEYLDELAVHLDSMPPHTDWVIPVIYAREIPDNEEGNTNA